MSVLKLYIKGEVVIELPIDYEQMPAFEQRENYIRIRTEWLKFHYRKSIMITKSWEIVLEAGSKMNY